MSVIDLIEQGDVFLEPQIHAGITRFEIDMVLVTFIKFFLHFRENCVKILP